MFDAMRSFIFRLAEYADHLLFSSFGDIENVPFRIMTESMNHPVLTAAAELSMASLKNYAGNLAAAGSKT